MIHMACIIECTSWFQTCSWNIKPSRLMINPVDGLSHAWSAETIRNNSKKMLSKVNLSNEIIIIRIILKTFKHRILLTQELEISTTNINFFILLSYNIHRLISSICFCKLESKCNYVHFCFVFTKISCFKTELLMYL